MTITYLSRGRRSWPGIRQLLRLSPKRLLPLLWIVEGIHDIQFLRGISAVVRAADGELPELEALEAEERVVFVPLGGSDPRGWATRFAPLGVPELHLYDREFFPDTLARIEAARIVNARAGCRAFVTCRPTLECYLHPEAIWRAMAIRVEIEHEADLVDALARAKFNRQERSVDWQAMPARHRKRCRDRLKQLLNTAAVRQMTPDLLAERDPQHEVIGWFRAVEELLGGP